jgi:hypothetical protein
MSFDFGDQTGIINTYMKISSEDRALSDSLAEQARERRLEMGESLERNLGPLLKLWCDSAMIAPDPENLLECGRLRFKAIAYMTNPQPSEEVIRMQRANESFKMIRAGLEIAGGDPSVSDELRVRLKNYFVCFHSFFEGENKHLDCYD